MILSTRKKVLPAIILLFIILFSFLYFIPPINFYIIVGASLYITYIIYFILKLFISKKNAGICALSGFAFLLLKAFGLFDTINAILLLCLTIAIIVLVK